MTWYQWTVLEGALICTAAGLFVLAFALWVADLWRKAHYLEKLFKGEPDPVASARAVIAARDAIAKASREESAVPLINLRRRQAQ